MLGRARHDRLFARFVRSGDVHALGEVFDATAPELMRIAAHLTGSREQSRDLVQAAFLIAIEHRSRFASERRVLPWLCGIVANLARNERRRSQRELAAVPRTDVEDPVGRAEAVEFRAAFARAKAALPDVYRPVLELHLEQGMTAAEIGSVLGRPAGTVRTQLVRGLEQLRRRLPRGFVAGLVVAPLATGALQAMRASVLRRAAESVPVAEAVAGGVVLAVMGAGAVNKKVAVLAAVAALIGLGVWITASLPGGTIGSPGGPGGEVAAAHSQTVRAAANEVQPASNTQRAEVAATPVPAGATGALEVIARWKSDDAPAASQAIDVIYAGEVLAELQPRRVVTDSDGRALFANLRPGTVSVQASTGVSQGAEVQAAARSTVTLVLDGIPVNGQVVDHLGSPVADASVWVSSEVRYLRRELGLPGHGQHGHHTLRTDIEGRFATRMSGLQCLAAFKQGHGPSLTVYPVRGLGRSPSRPVAVVLRLQAEGGSLTVTVRRADAAPVVGALVLAGPEVPRLRDDMATTPALRGLTDQAGLASLSPLPKGRLPVEVRAAGHGPWRGEVDIPGNGTAKLDVSLVPGAVVTGTVLDGDGAVLPDALLLHGDVMTLRASLAIADARGVYRLEHLPAGELTLVASHEEWGKVTGKLTVAAGDTQRWDVRMPARAAITGIVFDVDGQPAVGTDVCAYGPGDGVFTKADAAGRFKLSPLQPGKAYGVRAEVRLRGGGIVIAQRADVPTGAEIELRPAGRDVPTARLKGRVLKHDGTPPTGFNLGVDPVDGSPGVLVALAEDGSFELGPWPPCRVRLSVNQSDSHRPLADFGVHELRERTTVDTGVLALPAFGSARIRVTGAEEKSMAMLFRGGIHLDSRSVTDGQLLWQDMAPSVYAVCVTGPGALVGFTEFEVQAGRTAEGAVTMFAGRSARLQIESPDRLPLGPVVLRVTNQAGTNLMMAWNLLESSFAPDIPGTANSRGSWRVVLPDGAHALHLSSDDGYRGSASVSTADPIVVKIAQGK